MMTFSPLAWLKLMFFLHAADSEVGGFAVSSKDDPLYVELFVTVPQTVSPVSVQFDDAAVADYFDRCVDAGLKPAQFARIWCHTHPGDSPHPSLTDEQTFNRVFGACDWAVMFIVSRTGRTYARLSFAAGPAGQVLLDMAVDWDAWPGLVLEQSCLSSPELLGWAQEFEQNVRPSQPALAFGPASDAPDDWQQWWKFGDVGEEHAWADSYSTATLGPPNEELTS